MERSSVHITCLPLLLRHPYIVLLFFPPSVESCCIQPKMNDADVSKQIQQMVRFIHQEAEEKANEISVAAEEVPPTVPICVVDVVLGSSLGLNFVLSLIKLLSDRINCDVLLGSCNPEEGFLVRQFCFLICFEYSMQLNASRIKVLQAQDDLVNSMKEAAAKELLLVSNNHQSYEKLLKDLIVQSLLRLKEPAVLLRCRKDDLHLVESVLNPAKEEYAEKANAHAPNIVVDNNIFLPPPPAHATAHGPYCSGGVVLASIDGKIVCENTLDARLDVVFRKKLPEVLTF
ncbi:hypothetical protein GW17_00054138, partial [Ensete ventricosum]